MKGWGEVNKSTFLFLDILTVTEAEIATVQLYIFI